MELFNPFVIGVIAVVLGVIILKVFFTLWRLVEKKLHPEEISKIENAPDAVFRGLRKKLENIHMKNGEVLKGHKYKRNIFWGDGEYTASAILYFELASPDGTAIFISSADIIKIETCKNA